MREKVVDRGVIVRPDKKADLQIVNMPSTVMPIMPPLPNRISTIIATGIIVSTVYLPRSVLTNIINGVTFTPSTRITASEKTFFPKVCPFFNISGTTNSRIM